MEASSNSIAGLPIPSQEKVARVATHIGLGALGIAGILVFMPYINQALNLVLSGVISGAEIAVITGLTFVGIFAAIRLWPVYKMLVESFANKATWAVLEYDPITPIRLWLQEVNKDKEELESQYREVGGVISQNEQVVASDLAKAQTADKRFAEAVREHGDDSNEAKLMSLEPGTLRETAERIKANTQPLYVVRDTLKEVVDATAYTQRKAELDVEAVQQEYAAAQAVGRATDAANRVLRSRSDRKQKAMDSMKIIHDRYAANFGRLQSLRQLSQEVITSVDMDKGTYHQEALERLRNESRMITGRTAPVPLAPRALPNPASAKTGDSIVGSFYSVPPKVLNGSYTKV